MNFSLLLIIMLELLLMFKLISRASKLFNLIPFPFLSNMLVPEVLCKKSFVFTRWSTNSEKRFFILILCFSYSNVDYQSRFE